MIIKRKKVTPKPKQAQYIEEEQKIKAEIPEKIEISQSQPANVSVTPPAIEVQEVQISPILNDVQEPVDIVEEPVIGESTEPIYTTETANEEPIISQAPIEEESVVDEPKEEAPLDLFEGFDLQNIDFTQRQERRRGDRRRGYRRVDDRNLVSRAQAEAISIKERAFNEGFNAGLSEAKNVMEDLKDSLIEFMDYKNELSEKMCEDFLDLSVKIAEKIIKKEVESGKDVLQNIILGALEDIAKGETKIILKVSPQDVDAAKELVPGILSTGQIEAKIYVVGDEKVDTGSVIIETSNGLIDANISTQLEVIKESFKQISLPSELLDESDEDESDEDDIEDDDIEDDDIEDDDE